MSDLYSRILASRIEIMPSDPIDIRRVHGIKFHGCRHYKKFVQMAKRFGAPLSDSTIKKLQHLDDGFGKACNDGVEGCWRRFDDEVSLFVADIASAQPSN